MIINIWKWSVTFAKPLAKCCKQKKNKKKKIHFQTKQLSVGQRGNLTTFILLTDKFDEHW